MSPPADAESPDDGTDTGFSAAEAVASGDSEVAERWNDLHEGDHSVRVGYFEWYFRGGGTKAVRWWLYRRLPFDSAFFRPSEEPPDVVGLFPPAAASEPSADLADYEYDQDPEHGTSAGYD